jgi:hypothetical protein
MQALCAIVTVILALVGPGQPETPKGATLVAGFSGHAPTVGGGLPRLPPVPRLPSVPRLPPRPKWP